MSKLVAQLLASREQWLELEDGLEVKVRRPPEALFPALRREGLAAERLPGYVVDWRGFSEATVLGAAVGSSDPLAFDADLWREIALDHSAWLAKISTVLLTSVKDHLKQREADAKN